MKIFVYSGLAKEDYTISILMERFESRYVEKVTYYSVRAISAFALAQVVSDLTAIYYRGLELSQGEATVSDINAVLGEFTYYKLPKEFKDMFPEPEPITTEPIETKPGKKK